MAIVYNGATDFLNCGKEACAILGSSSTSISASVWFKINNLGTKCILSIGTKLPDIDLSHGTIDLLIYDNDLYFNLDHGSFNIFCDFTDTASWHHAVIIYNGSTGYLYIDGNLAASDNYVFIPDIYESGDNNILIGVCFTLLNPMNYFWDGGIFDTRIYKRILTLPEIKTIYHSKGCDNIVNDLVLRVPSLGNNGSAVTSEIDISKTKSTISIVGTPSYIAAPQRIKKCQM